MARVGGDAAAFHPIYALGGDASRGGAAQLAGEVDAIAMLGTGLPTLRTILEFAGGPVPVISPNLCLVWRAVLAAERRAPTLDSLTPWITGDCWADRYRERLG